MIERKHIEEFKLLAMQYKDGRIPKARMLATLNALADSALAAIDESPWRSMESAPRDGKYILIRHGDWVPDIAGWHNERPARPGFMAVPPGWFTVAGPRSRVLEPTHWTPLPAAPEVPK